MKKRIVSFLLALIMVLGMLPATGGVEVAEAATHKVVMTAEEFINCLKIAQSRKNVYNNSYPRNLGYYDGDVISWDCWNLGKSIIWTKGSIVNNYNVGTYASVDTSCGLGDWDGLTIVQQAPNFGTDFSSLVPGEWLYLPGHTGYYIGNGQVIECTTSWGTRCITQSQIDSSGNRSRNGVYDGKWQYHGMVPWLDYSSDVVPPLIKDELPSYCDLKTTAATSIMSLPCSNGTDASSTLLESVSKGTSKTAYKLVLNRVGNYWYEVRTSSGAKGYIPSAKVSVTKMLKDVTLSNYTNPPNITQGDRYTIQGAIKSTYNRLAEVSVYIYSGNDTSSGKEVTGGWDYVSNNSYTLANSDIDMVTYFNNLDPGNYTYVVRASWRNYYAASEKVLASDSNTKFSTVLQTSTFSVAPKGHTHSWGKTFDNTYHWEKCSSCGETRGVTTHTWHMWNDATTHWRYCIGCSATKEKEPHNFYDWAVTKEPTYTSTGTEERSCSVCGHKETRTVDRLTLNKPQLSISTHYTGGAYLSWSFIDGAKKYEVYRATSSNGTYTKLTSTTSCTYTDSNLTNGTTYYYKVRAVADNNYSQYSTVKSHTYAARYTVVGLVTSFLDDEGAIAVELYTEGSTKAKYSVVVTGNTAEYVFSNVEPGTYTMKVSKKDHATREYRVVVSNSNVTLFAEIFPKGDTDFDGDVNADDLTVLARHVAKIEQLTNAYGSVCADVDGNGSLSADDLTMLARYVAKIIPSLDDSPCIKHKWVCSGYDGNTGTVTQYTCSVCKTVGTVIETPSLAPADAEIEQLGNRTYVFFYSKK